jgi:4-oxalocrotonate tautomerase
MPHISLEAGQLTPETKIKLIAKLTEVAAEVMGIPKDYFFVSIHELPNENIAIGGKDINTLKAEFTQRSK